jgi:hypothetical protein
MNGWVDAPPPRRGLGCFARGCLILVAFGIVLALACFAGLYWGLQRHSAIVHTIYWLAKTHSIAEAPAGVPKSTLPTNKFKRSRNGGKILNRKFVRASQPKSN